MAILGMAWKNVPEATTFFCRGQVRPILDPGRSGTGLKMTGLARGSESTDFQPEIFRLDPIRAAFDLRIFYDFCRERCSANLSVYFSDPGNPPVSIPNWTLSEFHLTYSDTAPGLAGEETHSQMSLPGISYNEARKVNKNV